MRTSVSKQLFPRERAAPLVTVLLDGHPPHALASSAPVNRGGLDRLPRGVQDFGSAGCTCRTPSIATSASTPRTMFVGAALKGTLMMATRATISLRADRRCRSSVGFHAGGNDLALAGSPRAASAGRADRSSSRSETEQGSAWLPTSHGAATACCRSSSAEGETVAVGAPIRVRGERGDGAQGRVGRRCRSSRRRLSSSCCLSGPKPCSREAPSPGDTCSPGPGSARVHGVSLQWHCPPRLSGPARARVLQGERGRAPRAAQGASAVRASSGHPRRLP